MDLASAETLFGRVQELLGERALWQLSDLEVLDLHEVLRELGRVLGFATARVLGDVDLRGLSYGAGFALTESWLCATQRMNLGTARAEVKVARAVVSGQVPTVVEAWGQGHLDLHRAEVVVDVVEELAKQDVAEDRRESAEELMAEHGSQLSPQELTKVGKEICERLLERNDPQDDDPDRRSLTVATTGIGSTFGVVRGSLDQVGVETVSTALDVFTPQRCDTPGWSEAQRRGEALVSMAQFVLAHHTQAGPGVPARQVVATVPWSVLVGERGGEKGSGRLDRTGPVSGAVARQLACDAGVTIVVTGQRGEVLDVGRSQRFVTDRLRNALVVRDVGCVWPGCHRPSSQTEAHHLIPGRTGV